MARLLQDFVTSQAEKRPEATAVVSGTARLAYGELDALSTRLAGVLRDVGCEPGDRVALLMPKSPMAIAGLLGIYKAGCIYVPVDPTSPAARLSKIIDSCESRVLLVAGPVGPVLEDIFRKDRRRTTLVGSLQEPPPVGDGVPLAFTLRDVVCAPARPVSSGRMSHDPAHILFTSGSTGIPKGVVITHANMIHFIEWATRHFGMDAYDRVSGHASLHFDLSFFDIFGAAAVGAELHLVAPELNVLPNKLAEFIRASGLTQWFSVPSILSHLAKFDVVGFDDFPALRRLLWAGEVFPTPALIYWMMRLPHVRFTNLFGPTETTVVSSHYTVPACPEDPRALIPIGQACDGEELLILDEAGQPVPPGETGELYIAGVGLAREYWRDPAQTEAAFLRHPRRPSERIYRTGDLARVGDDGLVYFLGRKDSQIKSRGYRIELGEVESALNTLSALQECAVVALKTDGFEGALICCAYVPAHGRVVTPALIRRELRRHLPAYMLPSRWLTLAGLPHNANGKVDRRRLQALFEGGLNHEAQSA